MIIRDYEMGDDLFPAPAGMNRHGYRNDYDMLTVPRASGDEPPFCCTIAAHVACSPRQRG